MDVGALFLTLLTVVLVVMFVLWPFRTHKYIHTETGQEISTLLAERDRILKEIQELDFDNSLGKIPADEYPLQRKALLLLGVDVLRKIDSLNRSVPGSGSMEEAQAESLLAEAVGGTAKPITDDDLEELIARRRTILKEKTGGFCPKCGKPFLQSDKFCSCCGEPVGVRT
jgi:hypothetical protein